MANNTRIEVGDIVRISYPAAAGRQRRGTQVEVVTVPDNTFKYWTVKDSRLLFIVDEPCTLSKALV